MRKSKLLQNSKDLISRSFNPAKCKTSLRLAGSRLKLLRNKKEVQVKQMKREIAQLLESGQDQTARIRVEHVVREEKLMDAFDLLQIYCELFVARLPIIESQKNCPIDLKEAIASLVFAAPRCGDVPELLDVRKQVTAKYGKDFTTAAVELRPQCGVGRMLIEKLSATAPDGQTKLKILTAIAEGHDVKWDPKSFGDKDYVPENDTSGPSSFPKKSEQYAEPPHFEAAQVQEKVVFSQTPGPSTPFQSEAKPTATRNEKRHEDRYTSSSIDRSPERGRWNMEFKDATSAAQAAAESAERANMAARAAAELAGYNRFSRQYSTEHSSDGRISSQGSAEESHKSNADVLRDEGPEEVHPNSKSPSENTRLGNEKIVGMKPNPKMSKSLKEEGAGSSQGYYGQSASLKSRASVNEDDSQKNSLKDTSNSIMRNEKQSFKYVTESGNDGWPEKAENVKGKIGREHSIKYSRSQSTASEDVNIFSNSEYQKIENDPFVSVGSVNAEAPNTSSHASDALFIDKTDSDSDDDRGLFDKGPTYDDQEFHLPSSFVQTSPEHTDYWSPRSSRSGKVGNPASSLFLDREESPSPDLSKSSTLRNDSGLNSAPLMFDESDGAISESDEDMNIRHTKVDDSKDSVFDSQNLPFSSDDESGSSLKMAPKRNQVSVFDDESTPDDDGGRLNFGNLTGGFRHKGHNQLPFVKNRLDTSSSVKKEFEETISTINTPTKVDERPQRSTGMLYHKKTSRTQDDMNSESGSDVSEEEAPLPRKFGWKHVKEVKTRPDSFFGTDISDSDEGSSKEESLTRKYHMQRSGISRRTKASLASKPESHMNTHLRIEEELDDFDAGDIARKPAPSSNSETPQKTESHRKSSDKWETYKKPTSTTSVMQHEFEARDSDANLGKKTSISNARQEFESRRNSSRLGNSEKPNQVKSTSEPYNSGKATSTATQESKISQKSSAVEEPKENASIGSGNASNKNESPRKEASHVHPKLPDYDTLFQSLRMNRS